MVRKELLCEMARNTSKHLMACSPFQVFSRNFFFDIVERVTSEMVLFSAQGSVVICEETKVYANGQGDVQGVGERLCE